MWDIHFKPSLGILFILLLICGSTSEFFVIFEPLSISVHLLMCFMNGPVLVLYLFTIGGII
jgi:hypothetical protein